MRTFLLSLIVFLPSIVSAQWRNIYKGADEFNEIIDASFYTAAEGYVLSEKWVGATLDSGYTLQKSFIDVLKNIDYNGYNVGITLGFTPQAVHGLEKNKLLVLGGFYGEPAVLSSIDNGASWKVVYHRNLVLGGETFIATQAFEFPENATRGYALLSSGVIATSNGGSSWNVLLDREERNFIALDFVDNLNGYLAEENSLQHTSNGGVTWTNLSNLPFKIKDISAISANILFVLSTDNDIFYSQNSGLTWVKSNRNSTRLDLANDIFFVNANLGYLNAGGEMYQTRNQGTSWEQMPLIGPNGMGKIIPYNQNQLWACGGQEQLYLTTNAGGGSFPKAFFDFDLSDLCSTDTVSLSNLSQSDRQYFWYKNNVFFSSSPSPSYQPGANRKDELKLVVSDGIRRDSLIQVIDASNYFFIKLESESLQDSVCSIAQPLFKVLNSQPGVIYYVESDCCVGGEFYGNGAALTISASARVQWEGPKTYWVTAMINNGCGNQRIRQSHEVILINNLPGIDVINNDTVCIDKLFYIRVNNSRIGYEYWADATQPKIKGNGGIIELPCITNNVVKIPAEEIPARFHLLEIRVFVRHANFLCADPRSVPLYVYQRRPSAQFRLLGGETFVGDTIMLDNRSIFGSTYYWEFSRGARYGRNDTRVPIQFSFNRHGNRQVKLYTYSKEGCVDSITHTIEVFTREADTPVGLVCNDQHHIDSIYSEKFIDNRALYEDSFGSRILGGTYRQFNQPYRYLAQDMGWYAYKYDQTGKLVWKLESRGEGYAIEQILGDSQGNTILLGYCSDTGSSLFRLGTMEPGPGAFIAKVSPSGQILWLKLFYIRDGEAAHPNYCRGSILLGQNDEIYYFTQHPAHFSASLYMDETALTTVGDVNEGVLVHLNTNGQLLRKKTFPSSYAHFAMYEIYFSQQPEYVNNLLSTWSSRGELVLYNAVSSNTNSPDFDGLPLGFDLQNINTFLLYLDTTSLQFKTIKPIYKSVEGKSIGLKPNAFCIDSLDNYYLAYTQYNYFHAVNNAIAGDTLKPKTYLSAFDTKGELQWVKKVEGLQVNKLIAHKGQLKLGGVNYYLDNGVYIYNNIVHSELDERVKKLSIFTDTTSYYGLGRAGLGSSDALVATLDAQNGELMDLTHLGSPKMDVHMTMTMGNGPTLWVGSTSGYRFGDRMSVLKTFKLPLSGNCDAEDPLLTHPSIKPSPNRAQPLFKAQVKVFPNPFWDNFSIHSTASNDFIQSVLIRDELGRVVWQNSNLNAPYLQVNGANLSKGQWYFVEVQTYTGLLRTKIIRH